MRQCLGTGSFTVDDSCRSCAARPALIPGFQCLEVPGENAAVLGVQIIVILPVGGVELDLILHHAVVVVQLHLLEGDFAGVHPQMFQNLRLGFLGADVAAGLGLGGEASDLVVHTQHLAGESVDLIVIFLGSSVELNVIDHGAIVLIQLGLDEGDFAFGKAGIVQSSLAGLLCGDVIAAGTDASAGGELIFIAQNLTGAGVDGVFIFHSASQELHFIFHDAAVAVQLSVDEVSVSRGDPGMFQGDFLCPGGADIT